MEREDYTSWVSSAHRPYTYCHRSSEHPMHQWDDGAGKFLCRGTFLPCGAQAAPRPPQGNPAPSRAVVVDPFVSAVHTVLTEAGDLLLRKHNDYGPKNISLSPGGPLNGLRVRMWDKTARINNLIESGATPENESLRDSFIDVLNYAAIALLVLDGKWPE